MVTLSASAFTSLRLQALLEMGVKGKISKVVDMVLLSNIAYTNRDVHHVANINGIFSTAYLEELGNNTDAFMHLATVT